MTQGELWEIERDDPAEDDGPDAPAGTISGCVVPSSPESVSAALAMKTGIGTSTRVRVTNLTP